MTTTLSDEAARRDIAQRIDETLFVSAGAGSGKTFALVGRVEALVRSGVGLGNIAAITFTEKAAAELRDRLRRRLAEQVADPDLTAEERDRCSAALVDIDAAAISTLHSFAQRLLSEHPIEARLPPGIEVIDEIGSDIEFDDRWRRFQDELLDDPAIERSVLVLWAAGVRIGHLRDIARAFDQNWDLVESRVPEHENPPDLGGAAPVLRELAALADHVQFCTDPANKLCEAITDLVQVSSAASVVADEEPVEMFRLLFGIKSVSYSRKGSKADWPDPGHPIDLAREAVTVADDARQLWCQGVVEAAARQIASAIRGFTLREAENRRAEGRLHFHDLLVLARRLLRDPLHGHAVRVAAGERYQRLLLDEFQDTDPIQIELALLLATPPVEGDHRAAWSDLVPSPGRVFFVGDPKQSIYRFRRADIRLYLDAADHFGNPVRSLTTNFRSTTGVLGWVNHVFGRVIEASPGSQPGYEPLAAARVDQPSGPAVTLLGVEEAPAGTTATELRHREAAEVVETIRTALAEGWEVRDESTGEPTLRPARLSDVCVLLPARTSLPQLERALERAGIPFRAEASSLLYGSAEVRDLFALLRAIDDPTDGLLLVTALRSPLLGCGDDDLYEFRHHEGARFDHQAPLPHDLPVDHPVAEAMGYLASLYDARTWLTPSELIDRVLRERGAFEVAFTQGRFRDIWRRYRFVVDQARAYGEATGGNLRDYLHWVDRQAAEGSRVNEAVLPETDDNAVRILTVHASKGLEFPITIVSGTTTRMSRRRAGIQVVFPPDSSDYGLRVSRDVITEEFALHTPLEEQMDHDERLRLLYVACTRAIDHLVVSCHRVARKQPPTELGAMTAAEVLFEAAADATWQPLVPVSESEEVFNSSTVAHPVPVRRAWAVELAAVMAAASRFRVTSATAVARAAWTGPTAESDAGTAKEPRDLDLPPWRRGRYGTAVGRAVHGVLQVVDLADPGDIVPLAAAQATAEGVDDQTGIVAALARSALNSSVVGRARSAVHWKEVYVAAPVSGVLLEGYVDLVFEGPDGLVVVDYKTDFVADDRHLADKLERYGLQLGSYALALEAATGRPVADAVLVFCDVDGVREVIVEDLVGFRVAAERTVEQGAGLDPAHIE